MTPTWQSECGTVQLYLGDCRKVPPSVGVDAVVTSPPYAMQRADTYGGISEADYPAFTVEWLSSLTIALQGSVLINIREHVRDGEMSDYLHRTRLAVRDAEWAELDEMIWD